MAAPAVVIAVAGVALGLAALVGGEDHMTENNRPNPYESAVEAAVFRYETAAQGRTLRTVDCERPGPLFRGEQAYRCSIRFQDSNGLDARCYALAGRALYEVGGCFELSRGMGAGKSRLLTRGS